jgi:transcriptional regulator with XRE-family HTH domain
MPKSITIAVQAGTAGTGPSTWAARRICRHVGAKIRQARAAKGASIQQLSSACEMTDERLIMLEGGVVRIEPVELWDISVFLQQPISFFFSEAAPVANAS